MTLVKGTDTVIASAKPLIDYYLSQGYVEVEDDTAYVSLRERLQSIEAEILKTQASIAYSVDPYAYQFIGYEKILDSLIGDDDIPNEDELDELIGDD